MILEMRWCVGRIQRSSFDCIGIRIGLHRAVSAFVFLQTASVASRGDGVLKSLWDLLESPHTLLLAPTPSCNTCVPACLRACAPACLRAWVSMSPSLSLPLQRDVVTCKRFLLFSEMFCMSCSGVGRPLMSIWLRPLLRKHSLFTNVQTCMLCRMVCL